MKRIYKYATGDEIPEGAEYVCTIKNGFMPEGPKGEVKYMFVWHYYLVEVSQ